MNREVCFTTALAGLLFDVSCIYENTKQLCADYLTEKQITPDAEITIAPETLCAEQKLLRVKGDPGAEKNQIVEAYALCRKISEYLPTRDRVLFHGSCLACDGQGVLFTAKSGTGKSTHARLWREKFGDRVVMVNDDKPFLHITPEGTTAYGTPWRGKHKLGSNISAPLRAICIVCRGNENRVEMVSPREAFPTLLQQTYSPEGPENLRKTLALVERLSRTVPVYRLYCNMDPQAAEVAYAGIDLSKKKVGAV